MNGGLFGVRFLFFDIKKEAVQNRLFIYFATAPFYIAMILNALVF